MEFPNHGVKMERVISDYLTPDIRQIRLIHSPFTDPGPPFAENAATIGLRSSIFKVNSLTGESYG
jgi:hypothetical protein